MRNPIAKWLPAFAALVTLTATGCPGGGGGGTTKRLDGAGSSFVDPMMQEWAQIYNKEKGVQVNYQSKGSSAGIKMMTDKEVDFGCSDAPFNDEQIATCGEKNGEVLHLPLCMGAIVPAYNLDGVSDLVFDGPTLLKIFMGEIANWNDPALAKLNPKAKLPDQKISVSFRSDSSGSTYILSDYFTAIDKQAWTPGKGTALEFPVGTASKGNDGVAGFVKQTDGSIGYVELIYALKNSISYGSMVNSKGKTIKASMESVTAAAATATIPSDLRLLDRQLQGRGRLPDRRVHLGHRLRQAAGREGRAAAGIPDLGHARRAEGDEKATLCSVAREDRQDDRREAEVAFEAGK